MARGRASVRINVVLPSDLLQEITRYVRPRQRSRFITRALERELERVRLQAAIDASAGAWADADHPELADGPAIERWIAAGRRQLDRDAPAEG